MISKRLRFLVVENKVGMAKKIVDILAQRNMNIIKMEINPPYISVQLQGNNKSWDGFESWIKEEINEILSIVELDMLDFERQAKELQTIIDSMTDGVIAVGSKGEILYYNSKAIELFSIKKEDIHKHINCIIPSNIYDPEVNIHDETGIEFSQSIRNKEVNVILDIRLVKGEREKKIGALLISREMDEVRKLVHSISRPSMNNFDDIIGISKAIQDTKILAEAVSKTESNILILGESGTGKELFARAIHLSSNRNKGPFVAVNCSAVPENLIESEFFGYEKGAFTGANNSGKQGLFELAKGGSIFLDEIGELPIHLQAKILRVIQEKKIRRIGGQKEISVDARIISATHRDLRHMVREGTFREDLYYRLNVIPVQIAPLRERKEDIEILSKKFIRDLGKSMNKNNIKITDEALKYLSNYSWPGNVRELQNVIERAVIFAEDKIDVEHLMIQTKSQELYGNNKVFRDQKDIQFPIELPRIIETLEYQYITEAMKEFNSSREMAKALGISHTTVINKLKNYGLRL